MTRTRYILLWIIAVLFCCHLAFAAPPDRVGPYPYLTVSDDRTSLFIMVPKNIKEPPRLCSPRETEVDGYGIAYALGIHTEKLTEIWRVEGWYAYETYLGGQGSYLVRIWRQDKGVRSTNDPVIAFYKDGSLLNTYSKNEMLSLAKDATKGYWGMVTNSWGAPFIPKTEFISPGADTFVYVSDNGIIYYFNADTGYCDGCMSIKCSKPSSVRSLGVRVNNSTAPVWLINIANKLNQEYGKPFKTTNGEYSFSILPCTSNCIEVCLNYSINPNTKDTRDIEENILSNIRTIRTTFLWSRGEILRNLPYTIYNGGFMARYIVQGVGLSNINNKISQMNEDEINLINNIRDWMNSAKGVQSARGE